MSSIKKHRPLHLYPDNSLIFITGRIYGGFSYLALKEAKDYFWKLLEEKSSKYDLDLKARVILDNHYHLIIKANKGNLIPRFIKEIHGVSARYIKKNLPELVTVYGQVLVKEKTPWDKRQEERLNKELRKLKFANTEVDINVLAQFIARYKNQFKPEEYRRLKSAITEGRISDPEILIVLLSKDRPIWYQYIDHMIRNEEDYYRHLNYIHQNPIKHGLVKRMSKYKWSSIHEFIKEKGKEWVIDCFRNYPIIDFQPKGIID